MTESSSQASQHSSSSSAALSRTPLIFISAGDPSGDAHAARLVEALERRIPGVRFIGYAGPKTAATSCDVRFDLTQYAVMMLKRAILNIPNFLKLLNQSKEIFQNEKPDLVILVDFPGFNWKIAQRAKKAGIPVVYFMPPQIWGWGQWRVKKMRKYVDLVLSCFEFENQWFTEHGCRSLFISHPFFEEVRSRNVDAAFLKSLHSQENGVSVVKSREESDRLRYLTLLPGSRDQEVLGNLEHLLKITELVCARVPDVQPIFAAYKETHAEIIRGALREKGLDYSVFANRTPELLRAATCCLGASGSVSIEALSLCKPFVVIYRISKIEYKALRFLKRVKFITLTNLLAASRMKDETPFYPKGYLPSQTEYTPHEREIMVCPEFLSYHDEAEKVAEPLVEWLSNQDTLNQKIDQLTRLKQETDLVEQPVERAAEIIQQEYFG